MRDGSRSPEQSRRVPVPAVVVGAFLGAVSLGLVGVSIFVEGPVPQVPPPVGGSGIGTVVTPTELGPAIGAALPGR